MRPPVQPPAGTDQKRPADETRREDPQAAENLCPRCAGKGKVDGGACPYCNGTGKVTVIVGDA